jgi:cobalt-zinc-cadmium efflux system protein
MRPSTLAAKSRHPEAEMRREDTMGTGEGHGHGSGHGHSHGVRPGLDPSSRAGARHARRLLWAFIVVGSLLLVEAIAGVITGSLALLSDAGHMLTDVVGLAMALAAIHLASRARQGDDRSFGLYRLEILAALFNAILLIGVAIYVLVEAAIRLGNPPAIPAGTVLIVATAGLAANLVAFFLLRPGAAESVNVQGAYLEVLADIVGSMAVIMAAILIGITGWGWVDPVAGALLGLWILPRAIGLARQAVRILLQAAPTHIDLDAMRRDLAGIPDVQDVHDLHVWTLTSDMDVATVHLRVGNEVDTHAVLDRARSLLAERYQVQHATLQVEPDDHTGCDEVTW